MSDSHVAEAGPSFASEATEASTDRRLALLIDAVQEYAIFMLDVDGNVTTWNPGAARIKGYRPEEILGRHFSAFYTDDDIACGKPAYELAEATEHGQHRDEGWRLRKDGSLFWANVVITAIVGDDGTVEGFAKVTRDDTDREVAREQAQRLDRLRDRELIAAGLHDRVVHRVVEVGLVLEGTIGLTHDEAVVRRLEEAVALLDATVAHIRLVALGLATDES
jgi:PAS domain S-box-containing protein